MSRATTPYDKDLESRKKRDIFEEEQLLLKAVENGFLEEVKLLVKNSTIANKKIDNGWTLLYAASEKGNVEVVELLIKMGADVNKESVGGATPIYSAAEGGYPKIAKLLIDNGAFVDNADNIYGDTALHVAVYNGYFEVAKLLIENNADINKSDGGGDTPLHEAIHYGRFEILKISFGRIACINRGINNEIVSFYLDTEGSDVQSMNLELIKKNQLDLIRFLIDHQADVNKRNCDGYTPLHIATKNGYTDIIRLLLENNANANASCNGGWVSLHSAVNNENMEDVQLLLHFGANVNAISNDLITVVSRSKGKIRELLENVIYGRWNKNIHQFFTKEKRMQVLTLMKLTKRAPFESLHKDILPMIIGYVVTTLGDEMIDDESRKRKYDDENMSNKAAKL